MDRLISSVLAGAALSALLAFGCSRSNTPAPQSSGPASYSEPATTMPAARPANPSNAQTGNGDRGMGGGPAMPDDTTMPNNVDTPGSNADAGVKSAGDASAGPGDLMGPPGQPTPPTSPMAPTPGTTQP